MFKRTMFRKKIPLQIRSTDCRGERDRAITHKKKCCFRSVTAFGASVLRNGKRK